MRGATTVELAVTLGIAVLLILADVSGIVYLRSRTRDIQTLSEVSQIRSALEVYRVENSYYPRVSEAVRLADLYAGTQKLCTDGFKRFTDSCARTISGRIPDANASGYHYVATADGADYRIQFMLRTTLRKFGYPKGPACATSAGITAGACQ